MHIGTQKDTRQSRALNLRDLVSSVSHSRTAYRLLFAEPIDLFTRLISRRDRLLDQIHLSLSTCSSLLNILSKK